MRFHHVAILSLTSILALSGCANKKGKQYAGVDGDYVSGTPLGERADGLHVVDVGARVHELLGLRDGGVEDLAVVVPGVGDEAGVGVGA